jgi:hypothetical protein
MDHVGDTNSFFFFTLQFSCKVMVGRENYCIRPAPMNIFILKSLGTKLISVTAFQDSKNPITELMLTVSATESIEGKPTEIISVPWKSAPNASMTEDKSGTAPQPIVVNLMSEDVDRNCVTAPISWKRLQFKHATANNGRRKGLQQHYVISINLVARVRSGETVKATEILSGPIIVRGRSPRNFDSRKDLPLTGDRSTVSKGEIHHNRTRSMGSGVGNLDPPPTPQRLKPEMVPDYHRYYVLNALQTPLDLPEWANFNDQMERQVKRPGLTPSSQNNFVIPPVPRPTWNNTPAYAGVERPNAPIGLSLTDTDFSRGGPTARDRKSAKTESPSPTLARKPISSPVDTTELLYEYFPLSVDDWMPPVDAIYRPHVVHHTIVPEDLKAQVVKNKSKRYFSADD